MGIKNWLTVGFDSFNPQAAAMDFEDVVLCQSGVCMLGMLYRYSGQQVDGIMKPRQVSNLPRIAQMLQEGSFCCSVLF